LDPAVAKKNTRASFESAVVAGICFAVAGVAVLPLSWLLTSTDHSSPPRSIADWPFFSCGVPSFLGALILWRRVMPYRIDGQAKKVLRGATVGIVIAIACHFLAAVPYALTSLVAGTDGLLVVLWVAVNLLRRLWHLEVAVGATAGVIAALITNRSPGRSYGGMTEEDIEHYVESQRKQGRD
jgi:hypothetical protein